MNYLFSLEGSKTTLHVDAMLRLPKARSRYTRSTKIHDIRGNILAYNILTRCGLVRALKIDPYSVSFDVIDPKCSIEARLAVLTEAELVLSDGEPGHDLMLEQKVIEKEVNSKLDVLFDNIFVNTESHFTFDNPDKCTGFRSAIWRVHGITRISYCGDIATIYKSPVFTWDRIFPQLLRIAQINKTQISHAEIVGAKDSVYRKVLRVTSKTKFPNVHLLSHLE